MRLKLLTVATIALTLLACEGPERHYAEPAPKPGTGSGSNPGNNPGSDTDSDKEYDQFIFDTDLFEKNTDPSSGIVSYILKSGVGNWECSQSNYFVNRSMTNDERFVFFFGSST